MKPKYRVLCPSCGRLKILFESEKKAMRFIQFNKDEFTNVRPVRAYFCEGCAGWHVTHKETWD